MKNKESRIFRSFICCVVLAVVSGWSFAGDMYVDNLTVSNKLTQTE